MDNNIDAQSFLEDLIEEKGLVTLPPEARNKVLAELEQVLYQWLMADLLRSLPEDTVTKMESFIGSSPNVLEIQEFLTKEAPESQAILEESLLNFKNTYLNKHV